MYAPSNWKKRGKESQEFPKAVDGGDGNGHVFSKGDYRKKAPIDNGTKDITKSGKRLSSFEPSSPSAEDVSDDVCEVFPER